jgi:Protein of unknown function (DUF2934)
MARSKSPTGTKTDQKQDAVTNSTLGIPATQAAAPTVAQAESSRAESRRREVPRSDSRPHVLPFNLENEIRRRAYELSEQRGFSAGHETEDWLAAEREVLQRYRQQTA